MPLPVGFKHSEETRLKMGLSKLGNTNGFKKGQEAWNKGRKIQTNTGKTHFKEGHTTWNKGSKAQTNTGKTHFKKGYLPWNWNGGKPICPDCGKRLASYQSKKCFPCWLKSNDPTSIEKKVYEELKSRGLLFENQKLIGNKFVVDAYIPSLNLVVECDGDYWHSLPNNKRRDKSKDAYLRKCGYNILRLTELEINNGGFREKLKD